MFNAQNSDQSRYILDCYVIGYYHDAIFGKMPIVAFIDKNNKKEGVMAPDHVTKRNIMACYQAGTYDWLPSKLKNMIREYERKCGVSLQE